MFVNENFDTSANSALLFAEMDLAERIREAIRLRGIKQSWLAGEAGIPAETLSRIVTGTTDNPGVGTLRKIARALGLTVGSLLGEDGALPLDPLVRQASDNLERLSEDDRRAFARIIALAASAVRADTHKDVTPHNPAGSGMEYTPTPKPIGLTEPNDDDTHDEAPRVRRHAPETETERRRRTK